MAVIFRNPNDPVQPARGFYRWLYVLGRRQITFYIGESGEREHGPAFRPSTLGRGVSELQRATGLSANAGRTLTTRFIVGTAIKYLTEKGYDCVWQHVPDNPNTEQILCQEYNPLLQDGHARIRQQFCLTRRDGGAWDSGNPQHVHEAERRLYRLFDEAFRF